jgi:glycine/D-amino acid oxidase-like deaminating enzyme
MMSVAVIGGGFWGGAIQRHLKNKAVVTVMDPGDTKAASNAAQGLARLDWLRSPTLRRVIPDWWGRAHDEASEAALVRLGAEEVAELVSTWSRPEPVRRDGLLLVDAAQARAEVDYRVRVLGLSQIGNHVLVKLEDDDSMAFDRVVIAAGVWSDRLLEASGLPKLGLQTWAGSTVLARARKQDADLHAVQTHITSPYRHISMRPWRGPMVQIGATVVKGLDDQEQYDRMMERAKALWPGLAPSVRLQGWRPVGPDGQAVVERVSKGIIVATGGQRIGLVLAGGMARRVEELL